MALPMWVNGEPAGTLRLAKQATKEFEICWALFVNKGGPRQLLVQGFPDCAGQSIGGLHKRR
jgi:hypothetical protein